MVDHRWTRPGRHSYNTKQHHYRAIRTPGGKLTAQRIYKKSKGVYCGDSYNTKKTKLHGIPQLKISQYHRTPQRVRTVSRPYGGTLSSQCVRDRIVRAFLIEEQIAVKKVLTAQNTGSATAIAATTTTTTTTTTSSSGAGKSKTKK
jgi:large subunit ribosomal protein L34e